MLSFLNAHGRVQLLKTVEQLTISAMSLSLGVMLSVPLCILQSRFPKTAKVEFGLSSMY